MATEVKLIATGAVSASDLTLTTASAGTNDTSPATTAFVQQEITGLIDSAPDAMNTLNELAAALGDDANFSTTVTNSIATKLPLTGGTLTGDLRIGTADAANRTLTMSGGATGNAEGGEIRLEMAADHDGSYEFWRIDVNQDDLRFGRTGLTDVLIDGSGNVGIGISSIQTQGALTGNLLEIHQPSFGSGVGGTLVLSSDNTANGRHGGRIIGRARSYVHSSIDFQADSGMANGGLLKFSTLTAGSATTDNPTERMRIDSSGNVGIGTNNPAAALDVTVTGSTDAVNITGDNVTDFNFVADPPEFNLEDTSSTSGTKRARITVNDSQFQIAGLADNDQDVTQYILYSSLANGNVSIGTATPAAKLHVVGSEVLFDNTGGDFTLKLNTNAVGDKNEIIMGDTSTPLAKFGVGGTANDIITGSDGQDFNIGTAGGGRAINFSTDNFASVEMKLDGGNLSIGNTNSNTIVTINEGGSVISGGNAINGSTMKGLTLRDTNNTNSSLGLWFGTNGSHWSGISGQRTDHTSTWGTHLAFYTHEDSTTDLTYTRERMRIDSSGRLLIGITATQNAGSFSGRNNDALQVRGVEGINSRSTANGGGCFIALADASNTAGSHFISVNTSGAVDFRVYNSNGNVANTNNSYGSLSDERIKSNIEDAGNKLEQLKQVKVRTFTKNDAPDQKQIGVIAQELETIFPSMVEEILDIDAEGNVLETSTKMVKYSVFVPILIKGMQEQQVIIEDLKARIETLEG